MSIQGIFPIDKWDFKSGSLLADLPRKDLELLTAHKTEQLYKKGEIIFREEAYPLERFPHKFPVKQHIMIRVYIYVR